MSVMVRLLGSIANSYAAKVNSLQYTTTLRRGLRSGMGLPAHLVEVG